MTKIQEKASEAIAPKAGHFPFLYATYSHDQIMG